jgi:HEAT repeat protein
MDTSYQALEQLLRSEDMGDRFRGINQLRTIDPAVALELIQIVVTDSNARVRYAAISQLAELGKQDKARTFEVLQTTLLRDPEIDVRAAAADSMGALQLTEGLEDLVSSYHHSSEWLLQMSIVASLGALGDPRGFELLQEALSSPYELVVLAAIAALGELRDERALALLLPYLTHEDWQVRHRLAQALSYLPQPEAREALHQLASDSVETVAETAKYLITP